MIIPFLMTTVPKSGTNLLRQILEGIPGIVPIISEDQLIKRSFGGSLDSDNHYHENATRLKSLKHGEYGIGHSVYTEKYSNILITHGIKHIFLYRDPRDILVSWMYHLLKVNLSNCIITKAISNINDNQQRLLIILNGVGGRNFYSDFRHYFYWLDKKGKCTNTFYLSYEELVSSDKLRYHTLCKLLNFIFEYTLPSNHYNQIIDNMVNNINPSKCPTYRQGKIGSWKNEFSEEIKETFKVKAGELLLRYGFEIDDTW